MNTTLTALVKNRAFELGAHLAGVGNIERWSAAPPLMSPAGLMPRARAVLVCALHHTDAMIEIGGEESPHEMGTYCFQYHMNERLDEISFEMARFLEGLGYRALPITASNIWRYREYKELRAVFAPDMSHIYAAVAAGLAELGLSGLALTPDRGPRNRFVSVVTDAPLAPDPLLPGGTLCDRCGECVRHCCTDALGKEIRGKVAIEIEGRKYWRLDKNLWRCAWSEHFGLDADAEVPEHVDEDVILAKLRELGVRGGTMGNCLKFCLPADKRLWKPEYCRAPVRLKAASPAVAAPERGEQERLIAAALACGADRLVVRRLADRRELGADLGVLLPDVRSIVMAAVRGPATPPPCVGGRQTSFRRARQLVAGRCVFDFASALERLGYSGAPYLPWGLSTGAGKAALDKVGESFAEAEPDPAAAKAFLLTSAELTPRDCEAAPPPPPPDLPDLAGTLRAMALALGADAVGFSSARRLAESLASVAGALGGERLLHAVEKGRPRPGAEAVIVEERRAIPMPQDHLPGARSAMVLGVRIPRESSACLGRPPAEAIGPLSFAQYQSRYTLENVALRLLKRMQGWGIRSVALDDLGNTGSWAANPRGPQPNIFANRVAAVCAGLGTLTRGGFVNNPRFGTNMRYLAIVTDAPLREDPPADLQGLRAGCENCSRCLDACPVKAHRQEAVLVVEGCRLPFHPVEQTRCDWALRYGLVADEGQKWTGASTDVAPPAEITAAALAAALEQRDPILRARPCVAEMCAMACPCTR
jgi:epoxyqueuosine reductase